MNDGSGRAGKMEAVADASDWSWNPPAAVQSPCSPPRSPIKGILRHGSGAGRDRSVSPAKGISWHGGSGQSSVEMGPSLPPLELPAACVRAEKHPPAGAYRKNGASALGLALPMPQQASPAAAHAGDAAAAHLASSAMAAAAMIGAPRLVAMDPRLLQHGGGADEPVGERGGGGEHAQGGGQEGGGEEGGFMMEEVVVALEEALEGIAVKRREFDVEGCLAAVKEQESAVKRQQEGEQDDEVVMEEEGATEKARPATPPSPRGSPPVSGAGVATHPPVYGPGDLVPHATPQPYTAHTDDAPDAAPTRRAPDAAPSGHTLDAAPTPPSPSDQAPDTAPTGHAPDAAPTPPFPSEPALTRQGSGPLRQDPLSPRVAAAIVPEKDLEEKDLEVSYPPDYHTRVLGEWCWCVSLLTPFVWEVLRGSRRL